MRMKSLASIPKELVNLLHVGEPHSKSEWVSSVYRSLTKPPQSFELAGQAFFLGLSRGGAVSLGGKLPARYDALRSFSNKRLHPTAPVC